jgi:hypothetical protein
VLHCKPDAHCQLAHLHAAIFQDIDSNLYLEYQLCKQKL